MVGRIVQMADRAKAKAPSEELRYYPSSQINGSEWIIDALSDLADYCAFNQITDVETTLRRTIWEASLQLRET